jgi:hypothetical protein
VWVSEGCGRRTSYVVFEENSTVMGRVPGHLGEPVLAKVEGIVRMSRERDAALREIASVYERMAFAPPDPCFPTWVDPYFVLQADGARDLDCPRAEVVPLRFSRGQMAEGCHKRASYWGGRLACVVPVAP